VGLVAALLPVEVDLGVAPTRFGRPVGTIGWSRRNSGWFSSGSDMIT